METPLIKSAVGKDTINRTKLIKYIQTHDVNYSSLSLKDFSDEHLLVIFKRLVINKQLQKLKKSMLKKYPDWFNGEF